MILLFRSLEEIEQEINAWLENNSGELALCLQENIALLQLSQDKISSLLENPQDLLDSIRLETSNAAILDSIASKSTDSIGYKDQLSAQQWEAIKEMVCPYVLVEERPILVSVNIIADDDFASGIDDDKLKITYSIEATTKYPLKYAKLEVFKNNGTLAYTTSENIEIKMDGLFLWNGKMNQGENDGKYIRYDESSFMIKMIASITEDFADPFEASITTSVDEDADEWNDNKDMQKWVLCEGCSEGERYEIYKILKEEYAIKYTFLGDETNPLAYFKENITFDTEDTKYTFLKQSVRVHKNLYPVLQEIETKIKQQVGDAGFDQICSRYGGKIGNFSMRMINTGNSISTSISPHGYGLATDIFPKKNPQIVYSDRPMVFFFMKRVTGQDFYNPGGNPPIPSVQVTKQAQQKFLETFNNTTINNLYSAYQAIQTYHESDNKFMIGDLDQDIIKSETDEIKSNLQEIKDLIAQNGSQTIIQTLSETITSQVFITNYKIDELDEILSKAFNTVIFSSKGKAAINYMDNTYFQDTKAALEALDTQMEILRNELAKQFPDFNNIELDRFSGTDFSADFTRLQPLANEFNSFISDASQINSSYSNLSTFGNALRNQVNGIGFGNIMLEDGFSDLEEVIANAVLEKISEGMEWGGQYKNKKDWMHLGIRSNSIDDFLFK